jgi:putative protein-disulfide isomerase
VNHGEPCQAKLIAMMKKFVVLLLMAISLNLTGQSTRPKVIYIYDALCGWCFGFSPVMVQLFVNYQDQMEFDVISGGMVLGESMEPATELKDYIARTYRDIEKRTGITFGKPFLEGTLQDSTVIFNSLRPAIAMAIFRSLFPETSILFASELQKAIYINGMHPDEPDAYKPLVDFFGVDPDDFTRRMKEKTYLMAAREDFSLVEKFDVEGFPAVLLVKDNKVRFLTRGYIDYPALERRLLEALAE